MLVKQLKQMRRQKKKEKVGNKIPTLLFMNILGVDLSTKKTGWAFFENDTLKDYGVISCSHKNSRARALIMQEELRKVIISNNIDRVVVEDLAVYTNFKTIVALAITHGCLFSLCNELGVEFIAYDPSEWRSLTGVNRKIITCKSCGWSEEIIANTFITECPNCGETRKTCLDSKNLKDREDLKKIAIRVANERYGLKLVFYPRDTKKNISDDDIAEAILIAQAHIYEINL